MRLNQVVVWLIGCGVGAILAILIVNFTTDDPHLQRPVPQHLTAADPGFATSMEGVIGSPVETGHSVQTLVNGNEIFPAMLQAIQDARNSVSFETYIYWSGDIADRFAEALSRKAREGVRCHVLIDGVGGLKMRPELIEKMKSAGVDVRIFRPLHWYTLDRVNNRTHRKVLVIDGRIGFTGGVGIADEWNGDARTPAEWRDNHYRVEGPVVAGLQSAFVENWLEATSEVLVGPDYFPQIEPAGELAIQAVKSSSFSGSENVHLMLMLALAGATDHVRIAMAYFVPDEVSTAQLIEARRRGVKIDVMLPGEHIDSTAARSASRAHWGPLLEAGVRIWEFEPTMFHVKYVVVDDLWTTVGSANFDERGFSLNDEANISVYDRGFAKTHIDMFEQDRARSREVTFDMWKNRPLVEKAQDAFWSFLSEQM